MHRGIRILLAAVAGVSIAIGWVLPAYASTAEEINIEAVLSHAGILSVKQVITLDLDTGTETISQVIPQSMDRDGMRYAYDVSNIAVSAGGTALDYTTAKTTTGTKVSFTTTKANQYELSYQVSGTTMSAADNKIEFNWRLVSELNIDAVGIIGTISLPTMAVNYNCLAGVPGAMISCSTYTGGVYGDMTFELTQRVLPAGQVLQTEVVFAGGMIEVTQDASPIWTLGRSLSAGWAQIGIMALVLVAGGLVMFGVWRRVKTAGYKGEPISVAQFTADADNMYTFKTDSEVRPGLVGTLVDSSVDPADILATILDLAVRGHLLITEVETSRYATPDWILTKLDCNDPLRDYEVELLAAITTTEVKVSDLDQYVMPAIPGIQDALYKEAISSGWFSRLPSQKAPVVNWAWAGVAVSAMILAILMIFTTFGLVGLALVAVAIVGLAIADHVTHVTPKGAAIYAGLQALEKELDTHSEADIRVDDGYTGISGILPYAVVLGGWDRWLAIMQAADKDDTDDSAALSWYRALPGWQLSVDFPTTMDAFITVVTGELFTRA